MQGQYLPQQSKMQHTSNSPPCIWQKTMVKISIDCFFSNYHTVKQKSSPFPILIKYYKHHMTKIKEYCIL